MGELSREHQRQGGRAVPDVTGYCDRVTLDRFHLLRRVTVHVRQEQPCPAVAGVLLDEIRVCPPHATGSCPPRAVPAHRWRGADNIRAGALRARCTAFQCLGGGGEMTLPGRVDVEVPPMGRGWLSPRLYGHHRPAGPARYQRYCLG